MKGKLVPLDEPSWWYRNGNTPLMARALWPLSVVYGLIAQRRYRKAKPYRSRFLVICIGNFTAGGTGKTPLALHICEALRAEGEFPVFLTRGFKGREKGPLWVDAAKHTALDVGDEPLMLAKSAPTLVARDREEGAKFIESGGRRASVIIMDDGLQNPKLFKDLSFAVMDANRGVGNGTVIPSGPLRAPLSFQLPLADAIVINSGLSDPEGEKGKKDDNETKGQVKSPRSLSYQLPKHLGKDFHGPVVRARVQPRGDVSWLRETPVVAFAGIGNPARFFDMLEANGAKISERRTFPDHHMYSEKDAKSLLKAGFNHGARLVTTEKDLARLSGLEGHRSELAASSLAFPIGLMFAAKDDIALDGLLKALLDRREIAKS